MNLIFYVLILIISFFSRKVFLNCLGADFVGLTGTLMNLLNFLNLAELGISTAIGYVLYKPIFEHDEARINEIISVLGYMYRWIGRIIIAAGLLLSCFLPLIFPSTGFSYGIIYFAYYSFLASSLIGYFANYRQTLLGADQRNYVVAFYFQTASIIKILCQILSAWYTGSYYLWIMIELLFGIIYSFILNWKINQVYPWLKSNVALGKELFRKYPEVIKYTRQLFVHRLGYFFQFQVTPFLVYAFVSLQMVAYYGNYSTIMDKLFLLVNNLLGSTEASVGNLIAEGNAEKIRKVFNELFSLRMLIAGTICFTLTSFWSHSSRFGWERATSSPGNHDPDHHQPVHHCHAGCSGSIFIRLRPVLGCLGAHCRKRDQHFRSNYRRLPMGIARHSSGGYFQPGAYCWHLETLHAVHLGIQKERDELLAPIRLPAGADSDTYGADELDLEIFPLATLRVFPELVCLRLPDGCFLWRHNDSFNVLLYERHAWHGTSWTGNSGDAAALEEEKVSVPYGAL